MPYLCGEVKNYDPERQTVTVMFRKHQPAKSTSAVIAELSRVDCRAIGRDNHAHGAGLTEDQECVVKKLLGQSIAIDATLAHPEELVGRISETSE